MIKKQKFPYLVLHDEKGRIVYERVAGNVVIDRRDGAKKPSTKRKPRPPRH